MLLFRSARLMYLLNGTIHAHSEMWPEGMNLRVGTPFKIPKGQGASLEPLRGPPSFPASLRTQRVLPFGASP